jgi:hypothetical protein
MHAVLLIVALVVLTGPRTAGAGDPAAASPELVLQAECIQLLTECAAARAAAERDPMVLEHPPGVLFKVTSPAATRHVVQAIAIARAMQQKYGALPACARTCDDLLK